MNGKNPWIQSFGSYGTPELRLVCFPFAGGSPVAFRGWTARMPNIEVVAIQLPGRGSRAAEPAYTRMDDLLERLKSELAHLSDLPTVYYGHSMGAVVAFELALMTCGKARPIALALSGRSAPSAPRALPKMHDLPRQNFLDAVRRLGGMPEAVFEDADLMVLLETGLRADFRLLELWNESATQRVDIPLLCSAATSDLAAPIKDVGRWRRHTTSDFRLRVFEGDHFFTQKLEAEFLRELNLDLHALRSPANESAHRA